MRALLPGLDAPYHLRSLTPLDRVCDARAGVPWRDDEEPAAPLPPGRRPQRDSFFFVLRVVPAGERLPLPSAPDPAFPEYDQVRGTLVA